MHRSCLEATQSDLTDEAPADDEDDTTPATPAIKPAATPIIAPAQTEPLSDKPTEVQPASATPAGGAGVQEHQLVNVPEDELCLLPPTVFGLCFRRVSETKSNVVAGFSFAIKQWGQLLVASFKEVTFDKHAFDHLVLETSNKSIIRALVESTKKEFFDSKQLMNDVISGKGGGLVICLHGRPGTGMLLTFTKQEVLMIGNREDAYC